MVLSTQKARSSERRVLKLPSTVLTQASADAAEAATAVPLDLLARICVAMAEFLDKRLGSPQWLDNRPSQILLEARWRGVALGKSVVDLLVRLDEPLCEAALAEATSSRWTVAGSLDTQGHERSQLKKADVRDGRRGVGLELVEELVFG
eukprot:CAMPEP_0197423520 /NCGR_PEP_ID=MMETSP1170-20131217/22000_1 /TAXON_ID=54406 /ORGANISM="Sarcinochrysis sp, Strain CCMP770" /LENGTH=148 /DNA_ID=CAMNT_0042950943 /DNA_START=429 /DNA_END=875 /DNA_ORIENTATION=-